MLYEVITRFGSSQTTRQQFVAEVIGGAADGWVELDIKNKLRLGDEVELLTPQGNRRFRLEEMTDLDGGPMQEAPGGGYKVRVQLPLEAGQGAELGLLCRFLDQESRA